MERNLFRYILRHSKREQAMILLVVLLSQFFYFISLDLPKRIVNDAIQGERFPSPDATQPFLRIELPTLDILPHPVTLFHGFDLDRIGYLVALSCAFLFFVLINGWFKLKINTAKGRLGERMLRRLRYELFNRILLFPHSQFRRVKQAELATMIKDEVEPLGGFIGDAFVQPVFLGGQALTALVFILAQSMWLGSVAVAVLAAQMVVIPKLRAKVLVLGKERQVTARQLAGRIAEVVDGAADIHVHDTSNYERADIAARLARIYDIRFQIYQRKFTVKFLNNLLAQVTPFLFFLIGGYLAITGRLDIGQLVAVIAAYKDLPGPIKELIDWDQQRQDVQIKYEQVIDQFSSDTMLPEWLQDPEADPGPPLDGSISVSHLTVSDDGDARLLEDASLEIAPGEHVVLTGGDGEGKEALAMALVGLMPAAAGAIRHGDRDLATMPEAARGRYLGYAASEVYIFPLSVRDNVLYGLKHRPQSPAADKAGLRQREGYVAEALRTGNPGFDPQADWIDYAAAGASGPEELEARLLEVLRVVELEDDIYQLGLRRTIDPERDRALAESVVGLRKALRRRLEEEDASRLVEPFDRDRYNTNMSVAENLLFGTPVDGRLSLDAIAQNAYLREVLERTGLTGDLLVMGRKIAETMVELFADLPPGHPFFEQFSFVSAEDLPAVRAMLERLSKQGWDVLSDEDRGRLLRLTFPYIEARHRLDLIDGAMQRRLLEARRAFADGLPEHLRDAIEFYDEGRYNTAATLQDNILFGRLVYGQAQAAQRVGRMIGDVLAGLGLRDAVVKVGLAFDVGSGGKRLTAAQRQKLGMARALIKQPAVVVFNSVLGVLDAATQDRLLDNVLHARRGRTVVWATNRSDVAARFDREVVIRHHRLVADRRRAESAAEAPAREAARA
ncbi:MAG: ATP-binding cassette domain-containing protein [Rhodospirillaceae bacterium]|nr:ATP-binding cassette domain-containing protein [Rhodospirillaceae bacterium]